VNAKFAKFITFNILASLNRSRESMAKQKPAPISNQLQSVKKNVGTIHIEAKLSLLERKLFNVLLFNAYENLPHQESYSIPVKVLCDLIGYDSKDVPYLKETVRKLRSVEVTWDILKDTPHEEWGVSGLISEGKIKNGIVTYSYSPTMRERLYNPDIFARINLSVMRTISSGYTLAIYENCLRFLGTGSTGFKDFDLWRRMFGVSNEATYKEFKYFNKFILKPAIKEINAFTNIIIAPEFKKEKREVKAIKFSVKPNPQLSLLDRDAQDEMSSSKTFNRLLEMGVSKVLARQYIEERGEAYISEKLDITVSEKAKGKIKSVGGFLTKAIEQDYKTAEVVQKKSVDEAKKQREAKANQQRQLEDLRGLLKKIHSQTTSDSLDVVKKHLTTMNTQDVEALRQEFLGTFEGDAYRRAQFVKEGFNSHWNASKTLALFATRYGLQYPSDNEASAKLNLPTIAQIEEKISALQKGGQ
jgi:plasmid replication initiation protein